MLSEKDKSVTTCDSEYYRDIARETWPPHRFGSVKASLNAMHRFVSPRVKKVFTHRRARSIWEGTARRIDAEEAAAFQKAQIEEAKREQAELRARLARLDAALALIDEDFHGPQMAAHRAAAGRVGRDDLPGTQRGE